MLPEHRLKLERWQGPPQTTSLVCLGIKKTASEGFSLLIKVFSPKLRSLIFYLLLLLVCEETWDISSTVGAHALLQQFLQAHQLLVLHLCDISLAVFNGGVSIVILRACVGELYKCDSD